MHHKWEGVLGILLIFLSQKTYATQFYFSCTLSHENPLGHCQHKHLPAPYIQLYLFLKIQQYDLQGCISS